MAWELLKTDYKDAVPDGAQKYEIVQNPDGTVGIKDVTEYIVKEDAFFGALDANKINAAVNAIMASLENGTDLYEAFNIFFEKQKDLFTEEEQKYFLENQDVFSAWFERMKGQLTEDAAGSLQSQIDAIGSKFASESKGRIFVDRSLGDDEDGVGTTSRPYKTIQKAVDMYPAAMDSSDFTFVIEIVGGDYITERSVTISSKKIEFRVASWSSKPVKLPALKILNHSTVSFSNLDPYDGTETSSFQFTATMQGNMFHEAIYAEDSRVLLTALSGKVTYSAESASCFIAALNSQIEMTGVAAVIFEVAAMYNVVMPSLFSLNNSVFRLGNNWSFAVSLRNNMHNYFIMAMHNSFVQVIKTLDTSMSIIAANNIFYAEGFSNIVIDKEIQIDYGGLSPKEYVVDSFSLIYPYNVAQLGNANISNRGDGTVTGAIKYAADLAAKHETELTNYISTAAVTLPSTVCKANTGTSMTAEVPEKSGYKTVCAIPNTTSHNGLVFRGCALSNGNVSVSVRNLTSADITASSIRVVVLYQRT